jgi:hypothetical protein
MQDALRNARSSDLPRFQLQGKRMLTCFTDHMRLEAHISACSSVLACLLAARKLALTADADATMSCNCNTYRRPQGHNSPD